jgi:hypothetical protein
LALQIQGPKFTTLARENRSRRNLHGNEEESQKEETLTAGEASLAQYEFHKASQEKHLLRGFSFLSGEP